MEKIEIYYTIIGVLAVLNVIVIYVALKLSKNIPDDDFYDEDGDHIYYDRKLIRHKKNQTLKSKD